MTEIGMASPIASGYLGSRRKRKRTRKASAPPSSRAETTFEIASRMNAAWLEAISIDIPGNSSRS